MAPGIKYPVEEYATRIGEFLQRILSKANLDAEPLIESGENVHPDFETPDIMVRFEGEDIDLLLANKAEVLLALELLTQEYLGMPAEDHSRLCFDANDYRILRIQELRLSAQTAAERVKKSGQPFFFNPMNSRERRIVHLALREEKTLRSESVGTGPFRQVCVLPLDAPLPPPPPRPAFGPPRGGRPGDRDAGRPGDRDRRGGGRDRFQRGRRPN
jgi:spoIIIJ-associated protein